MAGNKETREVEIIVSGKKAEASMKEMKAAIAILNAQLEKLPQGTEEFVKKSEELKSVRQRFKDLKEDVYALDKASKDVAVTTEQVSKSSGSSWSALSGMIMGGVLAAIGMVVGAVINFGKEAYELAKTYSDSFADIKKSTGMTADEVQALNDKIGQLDTRTSQLDLLEIAKVGGQIGIAADQMDGFVESTDKAVVALGDEFSGGAEEVAGKLGTLKTLFKETKDLDAGAAINKIGSALNELGASGSATAPVVAEFATRMGQLGNLAPQISQTLGLGAAFQELGLSAEISAGGLSNILLTASKSTGLFAEHLGMTEKAFKDLINTNPNEVILKLATSFKGVPIDQVAKRLAALGITSQEATKVMTLLSTKTDDVAQKQKLANDAMEKGISLTNEFNVKNNTDAAIAEKRAKAWEKLQLQFGQSIAPAIGAVQELLIGLFNTLGSVYSTLGPIFSELFSVFRDLAANLGFAADKGSLFAGIMEVLGVIMKVSLIPFKLLLTVITALVGGFNYVYQKSALFRFAIEQMLKPLKMLWEGIKEVISWLGKLAEFADVKVKAKVETEIKTKDDSKGNNPPEDTTPATLNDLSSKDKKKGKDDSLKLQQQYADELTKAEQALEALRTAIASKGHIDRIAQLELAHQKEVDALEKLREKVLSNTNLSQAQKQELLYKYHQQEVLMEQKLGIDKENVQKEIDEKLRQAQNKRDLANADLAIVLAGQNANKLLQAKLAKLELEKNIELQNKELTEEEKLLIEQRFQVNKLELEAETERKLQEQRNRRNLANAEREIIEAGKNEDLLLQAKLEKLDIQREIELQNKELTEEEKALIEAQYAAQSEALFSESIEKKKAKERELGQAAIQFGQQALATVGDFAKIATDKKIAQYDREKAAATTKLDQQLKAGLLSQDQYNRAKARVETEYDKKATEAKRKQAKVDKAIALTQAIINTALAVVKALPNIPLSIIAGATGALGIAKIAATPLPEFAEGGYTGKGFGKADNTGFRPVGVVHEDEWVGPKWMVESPRYANVFKYLEAERTRKNGFADGGYTSSSSKAPLPEIQSSKSVDPSIQMMQEVSNKLTRIQETLEAWPTRLEVHNDVGDTQEKIKVLNKLIKDASM
ncbi:hypothetical protein [Xanthocytophaga flava]|uniref:hypothetical protein n=1 Tax=Xanthocytophaga flava TaxID=3048013 RepID=UPI0028CFEEE9|nr:hypothetical protein [Xanthocytophaga flavus]MDJ1472823.1 hypothetical protein [Xanthocytophaga flavus]